jgi:hypothetical protein
MGLFSDEADMITAHQNNEVETSGCQPLSNQKNCHYNSVVWLGNLEQAVGNRFQTITKQIFQHKQNKTTT